MKTFSRLNLATFVCFICLALMLVGNTSEANKARLAVLVIEDDEVELLDGNPSDPVTFEIQATDKNNDPEVQGLPISFSAVPADAAEFDNGGIAYTNTDGRAAIEVTFLKAGTVTIKGTVDYKLPPDPDPSTTLDKKNFIDKGFLEDSDAFAGHDFEVIDVRTRIEIEYKDLLSAKPETTTIVVLPPIPCEFPDGENPLSQVVSHNLSNVTERVGTEDLTPESLMDIRTHDGLLKAIKPNRDALGGLAARWDDPDPDADPADPTDQDSPPNMFRVPIVILNAPDNSPPQEGLSGWHFDISYNPQILEVIGVVEGDFLKQGNVGTHFEQGIVHQDFGEIIRISQVRLAAAAGTVKNPKVTPKGHVEWETRVDGRKPTHSKIGATGTGELVSICFRVKEFAEESLGLHNVQLSDSGGVRLDYTTIVHPIVVTHQFPPEDVNRDTVVNTKDLMVIAASLGLAKPINPRADVNNDGIVNALDLVIVAQHIADRTPAIEVRKFNMPAPALLTDAMVLDPAIIHTWIDIAQVEDDGSTVFDLGIANLEALLVSQMPTETKLLLNYPNPFNPETWIPYQLAEATEVTVSIYAMNGSLVRTLALGHQAAGVYQNKSQAAYWDGKNELGEAVASGVYFYTLTAGNFSATGKMLVRK